MQRTQILLTPEQHAAVSAMALQNGKSMSAIIRELVDRALRGGPSADRRALVEGLAAIETGATTTPEADQDRILYDGEASS